MKKQRNKLVLLQALIFSMFILACGSPRVIHDKPSSSGHSENKIDLLSKKTGLDLHESDDLELMEEVASWIGTPYKYAGNSKSGADCSGFTSVVIKNVYDLDLYRRSADQLNNVYPIKKKDLRMGDLVFFVTNAKGVSHVGIYLKDNKFVHASSSRGVIISDLAESYYLRTYHSAGRLIQK